MSHRPDDAPQIIRTDTTVSVSLARDSAHRPCLTIHTIVDVDAEFRIIGVEVLNLRDETGANSVGDVRIDKAVPPWIDEQLGSLRITFEPKIDAFYCYLSAGGRVLTSAPTAACAHINGAGNLTPLVVTVPTID
ncbi:MAG: hypothetical protein ACREMU_09530 [Gemmatimonadaceae bacterium]